MACPTCDHTMQCCGQIDGCTLIHWCPRCGTLQLSHRPNGQEEQLEAMPPKIVERCRRFETLLPGVSLCPDRVAGEWQRLGIAESINVPAKRSK